MHRPNRRWRVVSETGLARALGISIGTVDRALHVARLVYRLPRDRKKAAYQLSLVLGAVAIFVLQINLMERLTPGDEYGSYFFGFV